MTPFFQLYINLIYILVYYILFVVSEPPARVSWVSLITL